MLSNYCSNVSDKYGIKIVGVNKLVPNLVPNLVNMFLIIEIFNDHQEWN